MLGAFAIFKKFQHVFTNLKYLAYLPYFGNQFLFITYFLKLGDETSMVLF